MYYNVLNVGNFVFLFPFSGEAKILCVIVIDCHEFFSMLISSEQSGKRTIKCEICQ